MGHRRHCAVRKLLTVASTHLPIWPLNHLRCGTRTRVALSADADVAAAEDDISTVVVAAAEDVEIVRQTLQTHRVLRVGPGAS
jgi:hypothetical protein